MRRRFDKWATSEKHGALMGLVGVSSREGARTIFLPLIPRLPRETSLNVIKR